MLASFSCSCVPVIPHSQKQPNTLVLKPIISLPPKPIMHLLLMQNRGFGEMSGKAGGKAKPLKKPKAAAKDLDDSDLEFQKKKKEEAAALKALKEKAAGKGGFAKVKGSK